MSSFIHRIQYNWTPLSYDYCEVGKEGKYGTNCIFNEMKQEFQELQINGKITWDNVRELLFSQKKS